jgi:hypothetical protein
MRRNDDPNVGYADERFALPAAIVLLNELGDQASGA